MKHVAIYALNPSVVSINGDTAYDKNGLEVVYNQDDVASYISQTQYQRDRAKAYPSIVDQLDALYHVGYEGWKAQIQAVKDRYPK